MTLNAASALRQALAPQRAAGEIGINQCDLALGRLPQRLETRARAGGEERQQDQPPEANQPWLDTVRPPGLFPDRCRKMPITRWCRRGSFRLEQFLLDPCSGWATHVQAASGRRRKDRQAGGSQQAPQDRAICNLNQDRGLASWCGSAGTDRKLLAGKFVATPSRSRSIVR
jgi:hypothetical protein